MPPGRSGCWRRRQRAGGRRPHRIPTCRGTGGVCAGPEGRGGTHVQATVVGHPLSQDAQVARARLTEMGVEATLTPAELRGLGDAYYSGGRYERGRGTISRAAADIGFERKGNATALRWPRRPATEAEAADRRPGAGAGRYERRERGAAALSADGTGQEPRRHCGPAAHCGGDGGQIPRQPVAGRGAVLKREHVPAEEGLSQRRSSTTAYLAAHFPSSKNAAAAHWRAGWLCYRQGLYAEAARLFDEQIKLYPAAPETVGALYWRGRLYETQDHTPARAAANYRAIVRAYQHYFYAQMARARLAALGNTQPAPVAATGSAAADGAAQSGREFSGREPAPGQGAAAGQCGTERIHCARDQGRPRLFIVERAGRGADLFVVWRDVSRLAGDEAGLALCGFRAPSSRSRWPTGGFSFPSPSGTRSKPSRRRTIWTHTWWLR